ncbi:MAG TPA: outer membrane protein assembly factor BamD [Opitutaceae bacterium]|nr:outer membrane protein assembly factor BamD [Opitutaceae bacterium]
MRQSRLLCTVGLLLIALFAPAWLRAELVWSPGTGWHVEGGALAGLAGEDARNALDLMNRARAAEERGSLRRALRLYKRVTHQYGKSIYGPEAHFRTAQIRLAQHNYPKAFDAYQQIIQQYPNYERFNDVIAEQYRIASAVADGARGRWLWGMLPGFRKRESAVVYFEFVVANAPYSDYAPLALMRVAQLHKRFRSKIEAIDALDRMINFYPNSILTPDAYLRMAQVHSTLVDGPEYDQFSAKESSTYYQDFLILFPKDPNVAQAEQGLDKMKTELAMSKMKMAEFYHFKRHNYIAAKIFYNEAITIYPGSPVAQKARERLDKIAPKLAEQEAAAAARANKIQPPKPKKKKVLWLF